MQSIRDRLKALEEKQKPTISSLKKAIIQFSLRKTIDFDKYKALEMVQDLKDVANSIKDKNADYYSQVLLTLTEKIDKSAEQFKSYILALLGGRDFDRVVEAVNKIDKNYNQDASVPPNNLFHQASGSPGNFPVPARFNFPLSYSPHDYGFFSPYPSFSPRTAGGFRGSRYLCIFLKLVCLRFMRLFNYHG